GPGPERETGTDPAPSPGPPPRGGAGGGGGPGLPDPGSRRPADRPADAPRGVPAPESPGGEGRWSRSADAVRRPPVLRRRPPIPASNATPACEGQAGRAPPVEDA